MVGEAKGRTVGRKFPRDIFRVVYWACGTHSLGLLGSDGNEAFGEKNSTDEYTHINFAGEEHDDNVHEA